MTALNRCRTDKTATTKISEHAEADCFFCFTNLMSDIRDFFIKTLDEAESGINRMMHRLMDRIKAVDPEVEAQLLAQDIKPQFYSFRDDPIQDLDFNLGPILRSRVTTPVTRQLIA
jgi:hypothetical protein